MMCSTTGVGEAKEFDALRRDRGSARERDEAEDARRYRN
jgi:hypothetical protein